MKLLFDENLSRILPKRLQDIYPGSAHVADLGLVQTNDLIIWEYARDFDFVVTTKDTDYLVLSDRWGHPPKLVLVQSGNQPYRIVEADLRNNYDRLQQFHLDNKPVLRL